MGTTEASESGFEFVQNGSVHVRQVREDIHSLRTVTAGKSGALEAQSAIAPKNRSLNWWQPSTSMSGFALQRVSPRVRRAVLCGLRGKSFKRRDHLRKSAESEIRSLKAKRAPQRVPVSTSAKTLLATTRARRRLPVRWTRPTSLRRWLSAVPAGRLCGYRSRP